MNPWVILPSIVAGLFLVAATQCVCAVESQLLHFDDSDYRVVKVDLRRDTLEMHWRDPAGQPFTSIEALKRWGEMRQRELSFATNAGIYDRDFRPLGLYIEDSQTLRPLNTVKGNARSGNFSIQPNGVFEVDMQGRAAVMTTTAWIERDVEARIATQSGPMLVIDGRINPAFDEQSDSMKWRSGVCATTPGEATFAVSFAPVTFHAFAQMFRDGLGCRDALYLDGTLSQVYTDRDGYSGAPAVMLKPYVGMFAVFSAPSSPDKVTGKRRSP